MPLHTRVATPLFRPSPRTPGARRFQTGSLPSHVAAGGSSNLPIADMIAGQHRRNEKVEKAILGKPGQAGVELCLCTWFCYIHFTSMPCPLHTLRLRQHPSPVCRARDPAFHSPNHKAVDLPCLWPAKEGANGDETMKSVPFTPNVIVSAQPGATRLLSPISLRTLRPTLQWAAAPHLTRKWPRALSWRVAPCLRQLARKDIFRAPPPLPHGSLRLHLSRPAGLRRSPRHVHPLQTSSACVATCRTMLASQHRLHQQRSAAQPRPSAGCPPRILLPTPRPQSPEIVANLHWSVGMSLEPASSPDTLGLPSLTR